jgi:hypothetical protein
MPSKDDRQAAPALLSFVAVLLGFFAAVLMWLLIAPGVL